MPGSRRGRARRPGGAATPIMVSVEGARQMRELAARLKAAKRDDLRKKLRANLKKAGEPTVTELRRSVMDVKVTRGLDQTSQVWSPAEGRMVVKKLPPRKVGRWGVRSTGLRARVARATGLSVTQRGIRITVSAGKVGPYGVTLPRYLDGSLRRWRRWRHPVFYPGPISEAPPTRVVTQHADWDFFDTVRKHRPQFRAAAFKALKELADELNR